MNHKQELGLPTFKLIKTLIIKGGNDRLAGSCGCHYQIAPIFMDTSSLLQLFQNPLLKGLRAEGKKRPGYGHAGF
jgi:hypothetical protein